MGADQQIELLEAEEAPAPRPLTYWQHMGELMFTPIDEGSEDE